MKKFIFSLMGLLSFLGLVYGTPLEVGANAPEVSTLDQDGNKVNLAEVYKKGTTLVYFYPKADTSGCTAEACSLRDAFAEISEKGIQVIGVSGDKPEAQKSFKEKYKLPFTLIADTDLVVIKAFGVPMLKMANLPSRQSFLIADGKIVWRDLKASTKQQAQDVLKAFEGLKKTK